MSNVKASITFDEKTMSLARYWHWYKTPWQAYLFPAAGLCFVCFSVWILMQDGLRKASPLVLLAMGLYLIFRYWITGFSFTRAIRKNPQCGKQIEWEFSEEGYHAVISSAEVKSGWDGLFETYITPDGFLLYPQKGLFNWIPTSGFASLADVEALADILRRKTKCKEVG
jgi:hypothetical protein